MLTFRNISRLLLALVAVCCVSAAFVAHQDAKKLAPLMDDPRLNPQYAAIAGMDIMEQYKYPNQEIVNAYRQEMVNFDSALRDIDGQKQILENRKNELFSVLTIIAFAFAFFCFPWEDFFRVAGEDVDKASAVISKFGKSATEAAVKKFSSNGTTPIIGAEKLARFSVADEMLKWKQLLDDGVVTELEFEEARIKLLKRFK